MKYIKKFDHIKESIDMNDIDNKNKEFASDLYDIMSDFIDSEYEIIFGSVGGVIKPEDISSKTDDINKFTPSIKSGKELRHKFSISISNVGNYDNLTKLMDEMKSSIGRLNDLGWSLYDFKVNSLNRDGAIFTTIIYYFSKPSVEIKGWSVDLGGLGKAFNDKGLSIRTLEEDEHYDGKQEIMVNFSGGLYNNMEKRFQTICDIIGFDSYDYNVGEWVVYFFYNY